MHAMPFCTINDFPAKV